MEAHLPTLKDMRLHQDIVNILGNRFPDVLVTAVFTHMQKNDEDLYNHQYLRDSLSVANRLIDHDGNFTEHDKTLAFAIVLLMETGHPLTRDYPYDAAPGMGWYYLRMHARSLFNRDELRFITQSLRPLKPQTLRPSWSTRIQLVVHNTKRLTDIVCQNYNKVYREFVSSHNKLVQSTELDDLFLSYYGHNGSLWDAISDSAKGVFASEISLFKREIISAIGESPT